MLRSTKYTLVIQIFSVAATSHTSKQTFPALRTISVQVGSAAMPTTKPNALRMSLLKATSSENWGLCGGYDIPDMRFFFNFW